VISAAVGFILWYTFDRGAHEIQPLVPALKSWWMKLHVPANFIGYGAFSIAAMLGVAYLLQENYPQAILHLQQAVDLASEFETARNNLAVALKGNGDLEGAIYHLEQAIRINPNYAEAHNNLGLTLKEQGKFRQAVEKFHRALAINPAYPAARLNLEEAEAQLKRAGD